MSSAIAQHIQLVLYFGFGCTAVFVAAVTFPYVFWQFFHRFGGPFLLVTAAVFFGISLDRQIEVDFKEWQIKYSSLQKERNELSSQNIRLASALNAAKLRAEGLYKNVRDVESKADTLANLAHTAGGENDSNALSVGDIRKTLTDLDNQASEVAYDMRNVLDSFGRTSAFDADPFAGGNPRLASNFLQRKIFEEDGTFVGVVKDIEFSFGDVTYAYALVDYADGYEIEQDNPIPLPWIRNEPDNHGNLVTTISPSSIEVK